MGIKDLNHYFIRNCSKDAIHKIQLRELENRVIAIDASIFIYRFLGEHDGLIPQMYTMIVTLLSCKIIPIFIFDGKTPIEKRPLVNKRRTEKQEAAKKYNELLTQSSTDNIKKEMEELRRKSLKLTYEDLDNTKLLLDAFGISYIRAAGEADALCAYLVKREIAWASLSDDMDMFLYGCTRVLRHFNLYDQTCIIYQTPVILNEIGIEEKDFLEAVVINGTDYNEGIENITVESIISEAKTKPREINLYDHIQLGDIEVLYKICEIFHIDNMEFDINTISVITPCPNWTKIQEFLLPWGFVFP